MNNDPPGRPAPDEAFDASNDVRLSWRQWLVAGAVALAVLAGLPAAWEHVERIEPAADYRIPYTLSDDYWLFARRCRQVAARGQTFVLGDSVVWGHYVTQDRTLPAALNRLAAGERFANLGVDGIHPAALAGLIEHHGGAVRGAAVLLHANLLWMSSKRHDLQTRKEFAFNHPRLVPQFSPAIPCYAETIAGRLRIVVHRHVPLLQWAAHLRMAYWGRADLPAWTIDHPYACPLGAVTLRIPAGRRAASPPADAVSWTKRRIPPLDASWVPLGESFQWASLRRAVETLRARGNRVFVLLGPFNEHMLTPESLQRYRRRQHEATAWLRERNVPHLVPPALPTEYYADASHPLAAGYAELARQLRENDAFGQFDAAKGRTR